MSVGGRECGRERVSVGGRESECGRESGRERVSVGGRESECGRECAVSCGVTPFCGWGVLPSHPNLLRASPLLLYTLGKALRDGGRGGGGQAETGCTTCGFHVPQ